MLPTQNQIRHVLCVFGIGVAMGLSGAAAGPASRMVSKSFNCGLAARAYCKEGVPCIHSGLLHISVRKDGSVAWNGAPVDERTFSEYLSDAARGEPQMAFNVDPEFDAPYGKVATVILKLQDSNIRDIFCSVPQGGPKR